MDKFPPENNDIKDDTQPSGRLKTSNGIILVPQPTNDPRDPLNLPQWKKEAIFATITFAIFASTVSPLAGQLNLATQAKLYHKTTTQESYSNSAAIAGLAAGPYLFPYFTVRMGRSSIIFWTLLALLICQIWGPLMTGPTDYNAYIISRLFAGLFGSVVSVVGPRILVDIFFLHERGKRFAVIFTVNSFGSVVGPTLSGFISAQTSWPVEYWWTVGLLCLVLILCFFILEETGFDREESHASWPEPPESFIPNRIATFFFGQNLQPYSPRKTAQACANPFLILVCPPTVLAGFFGLVNFGVYIAVNSLAPVFLQRPIKEGGYGFTVKQNSYFSFNHWIGILFVLAYTFAVSDRLPLAICRRRGGIWKPEYRLHSLWLPGIILTPVGVALYGACLAQHLHYMVVAFAVFLVTVGSFSCVPIIANYLVECFIDYPMEAAMASNFFRIVWGLTVPFYINQWVAAVGVGWSYGMMALFAFCSFVSILILILKGRTIRQLSFARVASTEEGEKVVESQ